MVGVYSVFMCNSMWFFMDIVKDYVRAVSIEFLDFMHVRRIP